MTNTLDSITLNSRLTIVGTGAIGSRVAEGLVRMGFGATTSPLTLIDDDSFEDHNLSNQLARQSDIGQLKVISVREQLLAINPTAVIQSSVKRVDADTRLEGLVFLCLDSMDARRLIYENCLENNPNIRAVFETRLDARVGMSFCFDPNDGWHQQSWRINWYPDEEAENAKGCNGVQGSVIASVYGTAMLVLKQVEFFMRKKTSHGIPNHRYQDFNEGWVEEVVWQCHKT